MKKYGIIIMSIIVLFGIGICTTFASYTLENLSITVGKNVFSGEKIYTIFEKNIEKKAGGKSRYKNKTL